MKISRQGFLIFIILFLFLGCTTTKVVHLNSHSDLIFKINQHRNTPLIQTKQLDCAASRHVLDIGDNRICSHIGTDGSTERSRGDDCGILVQKQIISCNTKDQDSVYKAWEAQIYARNAIQNPFFSKIGCATYKYYWVCVFAY